MTTEHNPFTYDVFLSYASDDREWVTRMLLAPLEAENLRTCIDYRDFVPAAPTLNEIERAIHSSRKTLFIFSPAYLQSEWTELEQLVLHTVDPANRQRRFLVIKRAPCELPDRLKPFIYVDFSDPAQQSYAWSQLQKFLGQQPPVLPAPPVMPPSSAPPALPRTLPSNIGNPFTPGPSVHPDKFVGRKSELNAMLSRLETMGGIALVGEAGIGKTSLLRYLEARLPGLLHDIGNYLPIYLSLNEVDKISYFCGKIISQIVKHIPPGIEPEYVLREMERHPAPTMHELERCLQWTSRAGLRVVLLLDGFKSLLKHATEFDETFRGKLRSFYDDPYLQVTFVFAMHQPLTTIEHLNIYFANGVSTQYLRHMPQDEAEALLRLPHDHPFTDDEVRIGLEVGAGHPLRLQLAGALLYQSKRRLPGRLHTEDGALRAQTLHILHDEVQEQFTRMLPSSNVVLDQHSPPETSAPAPLNQALTKLAELLASLSGRIVIVLLLLGLVALLLSALGSLTSAQLQEWQRLLSGGP